MVDVDLLVFGTGSLARALMMALAARPQALVSVMIAGRNEGALASIALLARALAAALDGRLSITSAGCDYSEAALDRLFAAVRPRIVLVLASRQSPWSMGPRWRELVTATGYGFTLPLQAALADVVFRTLRQRHPAALCLNGCYPDMVNCLLADRGIAILGELATSPSSLRCCAACIRTGTFRCSRIMPMLQRSSGSDGMAWRRRWSG